MRRECVRRRVEGEWAMCGPICWRVEGPKDRGRTRRAGKAVDERVDGEQRALKLEQLHRVPDGKEVVPRRVVVAIEGVAAHRRHHVAQHEVLVVEVGAAVDLLPRQRVGRAHHPEGVDHALPLLVAQVLDRPAYPHVLLREVALRAREAADSFARPEGLALVGVSRARVGVGRWLRVWGRRRRRHIDGRRRRRVHLLELAAAHDHSEEDDHDRGD